MHILGLFRFAYPNVSYCKYPDPFADSCQVLSRLSSFILLCGTIRFDRLDMDDQPRLAKPLLLLHQIPGFNIRPKKK